MYRPFLGRSFQMSETCPLREGEDADSKLHPPEGGSRGTSGEGSLPITSAITLPALSPPLAALDPPEGRVKMRTQNFTLPEGGSRGTSGEGTLPITSAITLPALSPPLAALDPPEGRVKMRTQNFTLPEGGSRGTSGEGTLPIPLPSLRSTLPRGR
jgi:hypothetical protein